MLEKMINERKLPKLSEREKMLEILQREEYGFIPPKPDKFTFTEEKGIVPNFCAGKASLSKIMLSSEISGKIFSFPMYAAIPEADGKIPFFVHINFRSCVPDRYMPTEELIDNGFAVLSFNYEDITADDGDFTSGLAGIIFPEGKRTERAPGKIALWAWAAMRCMDYAESNPQLDCKRSVVCGHSRLGKTALLTGAFDERFAFSYSNDSGCSGAALSRGKTGETISDICGRFPFWFCEKYKTYAGNEAELPFDQHFLLAATSPRFAYVASAAEDLWADPVSELLCCAAASRDFIKNNAAELSGAENIGESRNLHGDRIGYHIRRGKHYFSREDWNRFISFFRYKTDIE